MMCFTGASISVRTGRQGQLRPTVLVHQTSGTVSYWTTRNRRRRHKQRRIEVNEVEAHACGRRRGNPIDKLVSTIPRS